MKYLLLYLLLGLSYLLSAQTDANFKRISTGVKIGSDIGILALNQGNTDANTSLDFGYSVLIDFIEYRVNKSFGVNLGVGFTNRNYRQTIDNLYLKDINGQALIKENLLVQNVEVPLTFRYYLPKKKKNRQVYCSVGSSLYFNLYHDATQEVTFKESIWEFNHQSEVNRTTFAANFNVGILFFTNYKVAYYLEPTLQINPNKIDFHYGNRSSALINIGVLAGLKF